MTAQVKQEDTGVYHLTVGTEVSAKYRGAFCEAQIKFVKKNVIFKVVNKKSGKCSNLSEENIKGTLKIGSVVQAQFPDQADSQEGTIQGAKDRSSYTVIFDDGDERTLTRGSLCLKGDRHYAKSETLDNLPLTDPENFGTPVLSNKKNRSRRKAAQDEYDGESEDQKTPDREKRSVSKERKTLVEEEEEGEESSEEEEDEDEKRRKWLADPLMGKVVIVEPNDKRKHWFPGLVVNPLCYESCHNLSSNHLVVRSFKTGKFLRVSRATVKEMTNATVLPRMDSGWKEIVQTAQEWRDLRIVPSKWRTDIKDILCDSEEEESSEDESEKKKSKEETKKSEKKSDKDDAKEKKNHDFLEILYKFMSDRGTTINKTPVLGYKDLDLYLLYKLVQKKNGSHSITAIKDWKQIYMDLGIPKPNPAAGYNAKTAYTKYLASYEEYCLSWKHLPVPKKSLRSRSPAQATPPEDKKKNVGGRRKDEQQKSVKKEDNNSQDHRKIKLKEKRENMKSRISESGENKSKGRLSPIDPFIDDIPQLRRPAGRRKMSESSSSASDITSVSSNKKENQKNEVKGSRGVFSRSKNEAKQDEKLRNPGGPDSEPDEGLRTKQSDKKESNDKKSFGKQSIDSSMISRRMRRNSTSNLSAQYVQGDKLKVKYGHAKTFKLYDAKVLQVKPPESPGEPIEYLVHYAGWNSRHDEWIRSNRIVGLIEDSTQSPSASSKSYRRPKTPNSTQSKSNLTTSRNITPSARLSTQLSNSFLDSYDEEVDSAVGKADTTSLELLKKNLCEDFSKSLSAAPSTKEPKRVVSPVLMGSQRSRRSKSPLLQTPLRPSSPVAKELQSLLEEDTVPTNVELPGDLPPEIIDVSPVKQETIPDEDASSAPDVPVKNEEETKSEEPAESEETQEQTGEPDLPVKEEPMEDDSVKSEDKDETPKDSSDGDASLSEETEDLPPSNVPTQVPRRTSGRRSKSPAYLLDSSLYGLTKKRRCNSSTENSPSPTPAATGNVDTVPEEKDKDGQNNSVDTAKRSPSPTLSISSSTSSGSNDSMDTNEKSPVLCAKSTEPEKTGTGRKRVKRKSGTVKDDEESKASKDTDNKKEKVCEDSQTSEYDNFDKEAPSIALEKPKKNTQSGEKVIEKGTVSSDTKSEDAKMSLATSDEVVKSAGEPEKPSRRISVEEQTSKKSANEEDSRSTRRKIRKRKSVSKTPEENSVDDPPESKQRRKTPEPEETTDKKEKEIEKEQEEKPTTRGGRKRWENLPVPEEDNSGDLPSSSNHENVQPPPQPRVIPTHPQNPPSSSKVLLENTPPTTPEHSPPYIPEEQENDPGKHSPLDSDIMDIGDEPKDSSSSASSTSSSSCENQTSSSQEFDKTDKKTDDGADNVSDKGDAKEECPEIDEDIPSPPPKKRRRGRRSKRRRTVSKGSRRGSYNNEHDSESEEEADDETGERHGRKRNESGSRCKPRKRKAKARPEPPSAPPPLHCEELASMSQDDRIALLQSRMAEMRKVYHQLKQEVANIDRKRKRAKRREREAAEAAHAAKRAMSPFTPVKAAPINGKVEPAVSSPGMLPVNKQAVANGKPSDAGR